MFQKVFVVFTLLAVLLVATAASSAGHNKRTDVLQQLLAKKEKASQQPEPEPKPAWVERRVERRVQLSDDEREIMTKQIMQAISEMMNSDCMLDRDYQGWVDFGRRDAE
uniref:Gastrin n=1 Tax=Tetraodon nigroviridis TaxID=99883 RepID=Q8AXP5_TETNG|nr:gastrin [Tetraodon nigroviridis]